MPLFERVFATLSDPAYFPGLWGLLNSIYVHHGDQLRVFVFSHGLETGQLQRLAEHPLTIEVLDTRSLPFSSAGPWEAKQQIMAVLVRRAQCVYLLDCDLALTSNVDDIFALASQGKIVSSTDGYEIDFDAIYARYQPRIVGQQQAYLNSGALCLDVQRHWDLAGLWAFAAQFGQYSKGGGLPLALPGHGDQGVFNALAAMLSKAQDYHPLPEMEWCDCTKGCALEWRNPRTRWKANVINTVTGKRQRLIHSSGPKWWTEEGRQFNARLGDKQAIFEYFSKLLPREAPTLPVSSEHKTSAPPEILIGVCSHAGNRHARDLIRQTWASSLPSGIRVLFFSGGIDADEHDAVALSTADNYASLPGKVRAFFRHAARDCQFDYLFKCDDDTYVVPSKLRSLVDHAADMVGDMHLARGYFSGGAGYLLSRSTVELFAAAPGPRQGAEDVFFTKLARVHRMRLKADSRLRADARIKPLANNPLIAVHGLAGDELLQVHQNYQASAAAPTFVS
jgi:hypothetical protein